ncbi:MAG: ankyrin repeat domain-containing protein [Fimbriimonas sp.]
MASLGELIRAKDFNGVRAALDESPEIANEPVEGAPSPILLAIYYGQTDIAHLLRDRIGSLSIQEAAALGDLHELSASEADLTQFSDDGFFPLGYAAFFGHIDAVKLLLERGAAVDQVSKNPLGVTPLHAALANGHKEIARVLIRAGADVGASQGGEGWTALHYCAYSGDRETAEFILERSPKLDAQDKQGRTPAELAEERGFTDLAEVLRPKGA